jgi:GTP-binding protein Era
MVLRHLRRIKNKFASVARRIFRKKKDVRIGLYGPVNSGKTTLANRICIDWLGEELGKVSVIPHETREIQVKERVTVRDDGKSLTFNLVDTPGIATKIDFEDFVKFGMKRKDAKQRAKEATRGVIESIKWLDNMDMVLVVLDSTKSPISQVNITILGNLDARNTPVLIVSNKVDLKSSDTTRVRNAFPGYEVIGISAKTGSMMNEFYKMLLRKL